MSDKPFSMRRPPVLFATPTFHIMRRSSRHHHDPASEDNQSSSSSVKRKHSMGLEPKRVPKRAKVKFPAKKPRPTNDIEDTLVRGGPSDVTARRALQLLRDMYGERVKSSKNRSVLDTLIETMLSQGTTDAIANRAYIALKNMYSTWRAARNASVADMVNTIRFCRMAEKKATRILAILNELEEEPSLEHLRELPNDEVKRVLCAFPGVGSKTAACVLMFSLGRADFPVDTHVKRICGRIGWTDAKAGSEKVYEVMNACLPANIKYEMNLLLYEHGQKTCTARLPKCSDCSLRQECAFVENR